MYAGPWTERAAKRGIFAALLAVLAVVSANGCSVDGVACAPGDWRYCDCAVANGGKPGYQQCGAHGEGYGQCDCSGAIPPGAGVLVEAGSPADAGPAEASGLVGFLGVCSDNGECASNLCFPFNAYGPHCSHACAKDTDCEAPSPGCSNKQVCKLH